MTLQQRSDTQKGSKMGQARLRQEEINQLKNNQLHLYAIKHYTNGSTEGLIFGCNAKPSGLSIPKDQLLGAICSFNWTSKEMQDAIMTAITDYFLQTKTYRDMRRPLLRSRQHETSTR